MKDRCEDLSHHERTPSPRSYISLLKLRQMFVRWNCHLLRADNCEVNIESRHSSAESEGHQKTAISHQSEKTLLLHRNAWVLCHNRTSPTTAVCSPESLWLPQRMGTQMSIVLKRAFTRSHACHIEMKMSHCHRVFVEYWINISHSRGLTNCICTYAFNVS